jgi:hypothetical protein
MNTSSRNGGSEGRLSALIRDQLHDKANRQFLARMPVFRPDNDTGDVLRDLLRRLDRAEATQR